MSPPRPTVSVLPPGKREALRLPGVRGEIYPAEIRVGVDVYCRRRDPVRLKADILVGPRSTRPVVGERDRAIRGGRPESVHIPANFQGKAAGRGERVDGRHHCRVCEVVVEIIRGVQPHVVAEDRQLFPADGVRPRNEDRAPGIPGLQLHTRAAGQRRGDVGVGAGEQGAVDRGQPDPGAGSAACAATIHEQGRAVVGVIG